jgi:hypothetical protein
MMCPGSCEAVTAPGGIPKGFRSALKKGTMKRLVSLGVFFCGLCVVSARSQQSGTPNPNAVVHVSTALNHLTVLEFHEPVTMAAAGSSDFQIERESNKVFVKPVKSGAATDLLVWTASRRFAYELEITQEVNNMNFAIDSAQLAPPPKPVADAESDRFADIVLTRALLGAEAIHQLRQRTPKNQVSLRVENVFRTRTSVYIHYTIENNTSRVYHMNAPLAHQVQPDRSTVSLPGLLRTQLDQAAVEKLGATEGQPLSVAHAENESQEVEPGQTTQGVLAIRQDLTSPTIVQLEFEDGVKATVVL